MVRAYDPASSEMAARFSAQHRSTMPTGVVKCPKLTVLVTSDQDALLTDIYHTVVTGVGQCVGPTDDLPVAVPQCIELASVVVSVKIMMAGQGMLQSGEAM